MIKFFLGEIIYKYSWIFTSNQDIEISANLEKLSEEIKLKTIFFKQESVFRNIGKNPLI